MQSKLQVSLPGQGSSEYLITLKIKVRILRSELRILLLSCSLRVTSEGEDRGRHTGVSLSQPVVTLSPPHSAPRHWCTPNKLKTPLTFFKL